MFSGGATVKRADSAAQASKLSAGGGEGEGGGGAGRAGAGSGGPPWYPTVTSSRSKYARFAPALTSDTAGRSECVAATPCTLALVSGESDGRRGVAEQEACARSEGGNGHVQ